MTTPTGHALWQRAAAYAARKHRHQNRKDGATPYYSHVARVTLTVSGVFGCHDPEVLAAAMLHDTIEDTTTDYDDLLEHFGETVADTVAALTKNMALPEQPREAEYLARLAGAGWRVALIKLADLFDNLADIENYPESQRAPHRAKTHARAREFLGAVAASSAGADPRVQHAAGIVRSCLG